MTMSDQDTPPECDSCGEPIEYYADEDEPECIDCAYANTLEVGDAELRDDNIHTWGKRDRAPEGFGEECPICGAPFDAGSSGAVWPDQPNSTDVRSHVRICTGRVPEFLRELYESIHRFPVESIPYDYVHKDEHLPEEP